MTSRIVNNQAVCSCGWQSEPCSDADSAFVALEAHREVCGG